MNRPTKLHPGRLRGLLFQLLALVSVVTVAAVVGTSPAHATSACDYGSRPGVGFFGNYVTPYGGGAARASCATVVGASRTSATQVVFRGYLKDTATDGRQAALYARFRVGGQWGVPKVHYMSGNENWHTWSFGVSTRAYVDMMEIWACAYSAEEGVVACGDKVVVYGF